MLKLTVDPDGSLRGNHPGVTIVALDGGGFEVAIDPLVAHHLQGSKRQVAELRKAAAIERKPWDDDRARMTDVLMKVTLALSGLVESYDWLMQSPTSGLADEGRARIQAFFLATVPAARRALNDSRGVDIDWEEVIAGRKVDRGTEPLPNVWATIAREVAPAVNGPEGAALLRALDLLAAEEPDTTFDADVDWLHEVYVLCIHGAGNCRAVMETDPLRRDFAHKVYAGLMACALNVGRQLALRQLFLVPEAAPTKSDPYIECADCLAPAKCGADRKCARFAANG